MKMNPHPHRLGKPLQPASPPSSPLPRQPRLRRPDGHCPKQKIKQRADQITVEWKHGRMQANLSIVRISPYLGGHLFILPVIEGEVGGKLNATLVQTVERHDFAGVNNRHIQPSLHGMMEENGVQHLAGKGG